MFTQSWYIASKEDLATAVKVVLSPPPTQEDFDRDLRIWEVQLTDVRGQEGKFAIEELTHARVFELCAGFHPPTSYPEVYHLSPSALKLDLSRKYRDPPISVKPLGFWIAPGNEWKEFTKENEFDFYEDPAFYRVILDWSNVLFLDHPEKIVLFTQHFGAGTRGRTRLFAWPEVKRRYSGIFVASRSLGVSHAEMPWDLDSGCIWDLSVIKGIQKVE